MEMKPFMMHRHTIQTNTMSPKSIMEDIKSESMVTPDTYVTAGDVRCTAIALQDSSSSASLKYKGKTLFLMFANSY